jgi:hypothetical protein
MSVEGFLTIARRITRSSIGQNHRRFLPWKAKGARPKQLRYDKELAVAEYQFDGKILRNRSGQKMGEVDRSSIRAWNSALLGQIERNNIRDSRGKKVAEFDGKNLKDDLGNKLAAIQDIQKTIDGEAGISLAAMWYFFVKK